MLYIYVYIYIYTGKDHTHTPAHTRIMSEPLRLRRCYFLLLNITAKPMLSSKGICMHRCVLILSARGGGR